MLHVTLLWPLSAALALGGLSLRYFSDHAVIPCMLLPSAFKYFRRTAENTWCCLVLQLTEFFFFLRLALSLELPWIIFWFWLHRFSLIT